MESIAVVDVGVAKAKIPYVPKSENKKDRPCKFFSTPSGCKKGVKCDMLHAVSVQAEAVGAAAVISKDVSDLSVKPVTVATIGEFFRKSTTPAAKADKELFDFYENDSMVAFPTKWDPVSHPLSHLDRLVSEKLAFSSELVGLKEARVACVYGAGRDKKLEALIGYTKEGAKLSVEPDVKVIIDCGPDQQYPGDAGKTEARVDLQGPYDLVVATDVYWGGVDSQGQSIAFGPDQVAHYARLSRKGYMVLITRMFPGFMGCDEVGGYKGKVEGVWIKDVADGMISFSPDGSRFGYPKHFGMEWLRDKSVKFRGGTLSCTFLSKRGPYEMVKVAIDPVYTLQVSIFLQEPDVGNVQLIDAPRAGVYHWLIRRAGVPVMHCGVFPGLLEYWTSHTTSYLCHVQCLMELRPVFAVKSGNGHNMDSAIAMVKRTMFQDPVVVEVAKRYPTHVEKVLGQTAEALLFSSKEETAERLGALRSDHSRAENTIVAARAPVFVMPAPSKLKKILIAGGLILAVVEFGLVFGAHARILGIGEYDATEPYLLGGIIVLAAICAAFLFNMRFSGREVIGKFVSWEERHWRSEENTDSGVGFEALSAGAGVRAVQVKSMSFDVGLGNISVSQFGTVCDIESAYRNTREPSAPKLSYPIAITNGMLFQPDRSDVNLLAAVVQRLHVKVQACDATAWLDANKLIDGILLDCFTIEVLISECADAMGGVKGRNLICSWDDLLAGRITRHKKKIMVKWNETIALKVINGVLTIKPRAIVVLSNEVHSLLAPHARSFSDALHNLFDGKIFDGIRVYYASGYSGRCLDELGEHLYGREDFIAASGDDSICCFDHKALLNIGSALTDNLLEGDFTAMDQSEKEGAIMLHCLVMRRLGIPVWVADFYAAICRMAYAAKGNDVIITGEVGAQLATGIDFTTVCNSLTTITFWLLAYSRIGDDPVDVAASLGLSLKLKRHDWADQCTFLKGWWQPHSEGGIAWCPLPSQIIKLGKIMREPTLFSPKRDWVDGVRRAAWAIAKSMPTIPKDYPLLGPFLQMLEKCGLENGSVLSASEDGWYKPVVTAGAINRTAVLYSIQQRYSVSAEMVIDCEKLILEVRSVPVFLEHPLFLRLAEVDYY